MFLKRDLPSHCLYSLTPDWIESSSASVSSLSQNYSSVLCWFSCLSPHSGHEHLEGQDVTFMLGHSFTRLSLTKSFLHAMGVTKW